MSMAQQNMQGVVQLYGASWNKITWLYPFLSQQACFIIPQNYLSILFQHLPCERRLTVGAVAHAPRPFFAASFQRRRLTVGAVAHAPRPSICELAMAPRKTSEMLDLLRQMGVTAYMPRQRGNLQNPRPLPPRSPRRRNGGRNMHLLK